jgi:hypothetical protein
MIRAYAGGIVCFSNFLIAHLVSYYTFFVLSFLKTNNQPTNQLPENFVSDSSANVANQKASRKNAVTTKRHLKRILQLFLS